MKELLGIAAAALIFVAYVPYIRDILNRKTKPHIYTWLTSAVITAIAFTLQLSTHAGFGAWPTLGASIVCFTIFGFGLQRGEKAVTVSDTIFFALSLVALIIWLFARQPVLSIILLSAIDMLAFAPTIRKSWHKPHEETLSSYAINTFRFGISVLALQHYSTVTALYPMTCVLANGLFSVLLITRRRQLAASDMPRTSYAPVRPGIWTAARG